MQIKKSLKEKLKLGEIEEVFTTLENVLLPDSPMYDEYILIASQYNDLNRKYFQNTIKEEYRDLRLAKISLSLIFLINLISDKDISNLLESSIKISSYSNVEEKFQLDLRIDLSSEITLDEYRDQFVYDTQILRVNLSKLSELIDRKNDDSKKAYRHLANFFKNKKTNNIIFSKLKNNFLKVFKIYSFELNETNKGLSRSCRNYTRSCILFILATSLNGNQPKEKEIESILNSIESLINSLKALIVELDKQVVKDKSLKLQVQKEREYENIKENVINSHEELIEVFYYFIQYLNVYKIQIDKFKSFLIPT